MCVEEELELEEIQRRNTCVSVVCFLMLQSARGLRVNGREERESE